MNSIIESMRTPRAAGSAALCWMGNAGWLIRTAEALFSVDLDLLAAVPRAVPSPAVPEDLAGLDYALYTHEHGDHFHPETASRLAAATGCRFILPQSCLAAASEIGLPGERVTVAHPGVPLDLPGLRLAPTRALHGHCAGSVHTGANLEDCGYHAVSGGVSFFIPGDTLLLQDHAALPPVDVLMVSPTEHNTWIEPSRTLIDWIRPRRVFAQHFGTYIITENNSFWTRGYERELGDTLPDGVRYVIPTLGEIYEVSVPEEEEALS